MVEAIDATRTADSDPVAKQALFRRFEADCSFPKRAVLLWDGCRRERGTHYCWPGGFNDKWRDYRRRFGCGRLLKARSNGPPRSAFTVAGGNYVNGNELAHLYSESALIQDGLDEGRHFTQSANLICVPRSRHLQMDSLQGMHELWLLRGLSFLLFRYDPLGKFSGDHPDGYGFVAGCTCDIVWP